jgi:hypothetical protein
MTQENVLAAYTKLCELQSDINEHLPTLKKYAEECDHVTEMGVRSIVSTWALLAGKPKTMVSIDINNIDCSQVKKEAGRTTAFSFIQGNTLEMEIDETDLLFIDTYHNYDQLTIELQRHASKARKYIILHDTTTFAEVGESYDGIQRRGLWPAVTEFLEASGNWEILERFENNNGLTILHRI